MRFVAIVLVALGLAACSANTAGIDRYSAQELSLQKASGNPIYR